MNFLVAANESYLFPLKVMLTSLLDSNIGERHKIYYLYSNVSDESIHNMKEYIEKRYECSFFPCYVDASSFTEFPIKEHFSIETYYRFLAQEIIPASEDRILWLDADMIVKKSLKNFYYQDFDGKTLVVCKSINANPQQLLDKLGCPEGTVYFNAGTILFNLALLRHVKLKDYYDYYIKNEEKITWLDQDILNAVYALKTKIADYHQFNMQLFAGTKFTNEELLDIEENTSIIHYIGAEKPWHSTYRNPCQKYWIHYAKKAWTTKQHILFSIKRLCRKMESYWRNRSFVGRKIQACRIHMHWLRRMCHPGKKIAYLLATPHHGNIGDSTIEIAERDFLLRNGYDYVVDITTTDVWNSGKCIKKFIPKGVPIYLHGGGNMGDEYYKEEILRKHIFSMFAGHPIVIFPQTIYYSDTHQGKKRERDSVETYDTYSELTVFAREKESYRIMTELYPNITVILTPDIVLSMSSQQKKLKRKGILVCLRDDCEKQLTEDDEAVLLKVLSKLGERVDRTDMMADMLISPEQREKVVEEKLVQFSRAKVLVTDRLHGMVFAAITGTPCIVLSNYNHKVKGTYEWIRYLPYIRYAESVDDVEKYLPEILALENCEYDNKPLLPYFERIAEVVKKYAEN